MRTLPDRIRHTVMFELIAITLMTFVGSKITGKPIETVGVLTLILSGLATSWNLTYNWLFDLWDHKYRNAAPRGVMIRIVHALLFEAFLIVVATFVIAWWLDMSLMRAFLLDIGVAAFFLVYAFCYNWTYDVIFPVPRRVEAKAEA